MKWFTQNKETSQSSDTIKEATSEVTKKSKNKSVGVTIYEMTLFAMFGSIMFASKMLMEFLPNMHLLGVFIVLFTVVYRVKALIPIYIYVFLNGIIAGFAPWWVPYLYVWTVLWGMTMLIPKNIPKKFAIFVYPIVCSLHGFLFGIIYAPGEAFIFGLDFRQMIAWVVAGAGFDVIHGVSNLILGILIYPMTVLLKKLNSTVTMKLNR